MPQRLAQAHLPDRVYYCLDLLLGHSEASRIAGLLVSRHRPAFVVEQHPVASQGSRPVVTKIFSFLSFQLRALEAGEPAREVAAAVELADDGDGVVARGEVRARPAP